MYINFDETELGCAVTPFGELHFGAKILRLTGYILVPTFPRSFVLASDLLFLWFPVM